MFQMDVIYSLLALYTTTLVADRSLRVKGHKGPATDHFDGKYFYNYEGTPGKSEAGNGLKALTKWMIKRHRGAIRWKRDLKSPLDSNIPKERVFGKELSVTFINHSTVLLQTEGLNILTDPVWSIRTSPFPYVGPKRFKRGGLAFEKLPPIDIVLISHNHYDHLDLPTLKKIRAKWNPKVFVPLGNKSFLISHGFKNVSELDWWENEKLNDAVNIVCTPAKHFSSRAFSDRNKTLWAGYVIETPHGNIYFAGDTAYGVFVQKIREHYPDGFRFGLLPIGAFKPEWFMGPVHISPKQALQIHKDLGIQTTLGIHFGTFHLADDGPHEPPDRIRELVEQSPDPKPDFRTISNGKSIEL